MSKESAEQLRETEFFRKNSVSLHYFLTGAIERFPNPQPYPKPLSQPKFDRNWHLSAHGRMREHF